MSKHSQKFSYRSSSPEDREQTQLRDKRRRLSVRSLLFAVSIIFILFVIIRFFFIPHQPIISFYTTRVYYPNTYFAYSRKVVSDVAWVFIIAVFMSLALIITGTAFSRSRSAQLTDFRGRSRWSIVGDILSKIGWGILVLCFFLFF